MDDSVLTDVTIAWLYKQKYVEPHKGGWIVDDCWVDNESMRKHAETCTACRAAALRATQWKADAGKQFTHIEPHGETVVDAQEFTMFPPEESDKSPFTVLVDYNREELRVDDRWLDDDDPMADVYWAAINAAGA